MRVLVGGLHHESDTFNPIITNSCDVRVIRGEELIETKREDSITGIIETLLSNNIEVVPTLIARAVPNGEWDPILYKTLKEEILETARKEKLDGICLALHGSMRIKDIGEAEGDLLESLRMIHPSIPIVTSLDMHGTISKRMLDNADAFVGYKTAPHIDERETGREAAKLLIHALKGGKLSMSAIHIPFLVAGEKSETSVEPMKGIMEKVRNEEEKEGILSSSILMGFPWADTEDGGVTAISVTDGSEERAYESASLLASIFWNKRNEFIFYNETRMPEEAPLEPSLVYQAFYDPVLLEKSFEKGEGEIVEGNLGAYFDREKSTPIKVRAKVKKLLRNWGELYKTDLALLDVEGIDVILTSRHVGCYDVDMMGALGIDIRERKAVVVKLGYLEPEIRALSSSSFMVLTKGSSDEILQRLPYSRIKRPIWPLDKEGDWKLERLK